LLLHRRHRGTYAGSLRDWEYPEWYYDDDDSEPDEKILKYETAEDGVPDFMYRDVSQDDEVPTDPFNGLWTGTYSYLAPIAIEDGLVSAHLQFLDDEGQNGFVGFGRDSIGSFKMSGTITQSETTSIRHIRFKKEYEPIKGREDTVWAYHGTVSVEDSTRMTAMRGEWGEWVGDPSKFEAFGTFQMDRTPAIVARHRPSVAEFETNAARARWKLALNVVEEQVQRKLLNSKYVRQRRDDREKFVEASFVRHIAPRSSAFCTLTIARYVCTRPHEISSYMDQQR
jgi:hypothetical protein